MQTFGCLYKIGVCFMYEIFEKLLIERGVTAYRVSLETGISTATLTDWKKGRSTPKVDKLQKIAAYFGVTVDTLLGKEPEAAAQAADQESLQLDDFTYAMYQQSRELTQENKQKLLEMAQFFKAQQDKERP